VVGFDEIERALRALWRGKTGAAIWPIKQQRALMSLAYVSARAQQEAAATEPTPDQVARAFQRCLSDACNSWANSPTDPQVAKMLFGLTRGVKGAELRLRRRRISEQYGISEETLKHKRAGSSYETRAISVIAEAILHEEETHYRRQAETAEPPGVDRLDGESASFWECVSYRADLYIPDRFPRLPTLDRIFDLVSTDDSAQLFSFHDGRTKPGVPATFNYYTGQSFVNVIATTAPDGRPIAVLDLGKKFARGSALSLKVQGTYEDYELQSEGSFGFLVDPDGPSARVTVAISLPAETWDKSAQVQQSLSWDVHGHVVVPSGDTDNHRTWKIEPQPPVENKAHEKVFEMSEAAVPPGATCKVTWALINNH